MNRDTSLLIAALLSTMGGIFLGLVGMVLQVNLLGHGPFTTSNYVGAVLMFAAPAGTGIVCAGAACLAHARWLRILSGLMSAGAFLVLAMLLGGIVCGKIDDQRGQRFLAKQREERESFAKSFEEAIAIAREGRQDLRIVGRYPARDGVLVDALLIAPEDLISEEDIQVSAGSITVFRWIRPIDGTPVPSIEWTAPPPEFIEQFKDDPAYQDIIHGPPKPEPQPVRRFLLLLKDAPEAIELHTPFGSFPLPETAEQPVSVVIGEPFRGQRVGENLRLLD